MKYSPENGRARPPGQVDQNLGKEHETMSRIRPSPDRFVGLDVHKHYLIAVAVDADRNEVLGPRRVPLERLDAWVRKTLTSHDAVVLEMTTNAYQLYDDLLPHVHSVTVVHPPHVALITRAQVMTDKIAARALANLHAVGLLPCIWIPPSEVRDHRALVAQRTKMVRLSTQAKNRLHALLHRHHVLPPAGMLFDPAMREWWLELEISALEKARVRCDLDTLLFAQGQIHLLEETMLALAVQDERVILLLQLPGVGLVTAITLLAAIGDISRFAQAKNLVGYAGLGARVHDSGQTHHTGHITKAGRRDIRGAMIEVAHTAARTHPHWRAELARLEPRLGKNKAIVAIARKLLVAVWHILTSGCPDRFADPERVARKLLEHAKHLGRDRRPEGQTAVQYVRHHLDRLGLGAELASIPLGKTRCIALPPSQLAAEANRMPGRLPPTVSGEWPAAS
jgi:transposase